MKWNKDKSLLLSKVSVVAFALLYAAVCCAAPWLNQFGWWFTALFAGLVQYIVFTIYAVALPVFAALWALYRLLRNISAEQVVVAQNVRCLRIISWCCVAAGLIFFASGFYAVSFFILSAVAMFIGLILRVVKNVFAEAVSLKNENDLTI